MLLLGGIRNNYYPNGDGYGAGLLAYVTHGNGHGDGLTGDRCGGGEGTYWHYETNKERLLEYFKSHV